MADVKKAIIEKIKNYDTIIIARHVRPDGDACGASFGLKYIIKESFPDKRVFVVNNDVTPSLEFLGEEEKVSEDVYENALAVTVDCPTLSRVANEKITLAKELIKIDHPLEVEPFGDISWVESGRSSVCEMIADLALSSFELKLTQRAAFCLYLGIVTDTDRFKFKSTSPETLRIAAKLRDVGVDVDEISSHIYLETQNFIKFKAYIYKKIKITRNGVASLYISRAMQEKFSLTSEEASDTVTFIQNIKGSQIWAVFIENTDDDNIRIKLRSRYVKVNELAEKYRGGGHANACGATLYSKREYIKFLREADRLLSKFKVENPDKE